LAGDLLAAQSKFEIFNFYRFWDWHTAWRFIFIPKLASYGRLQLADDTKPPHGGFLLQL
jgi:hypothetical protein